MAFGIIGSFVTLEVTGICQVPAAATSVRGGADLISGMVMRLSGSTSNMRGMRSRAPGLRWLGRLYMPPLIFLNRLGMFSSSKGRLPQSSAYRMTPHDQTSTSGPAYSLPEITWRGRAKQASDFTSFGSVLVRVWAGGGDSAHYARGFSLMAKYTYTQPQHNDGTCTGHDCT